MKKRNLFGVLGLTLSFCSCSNLEELPIDSSPTSNEIITRTAGDGKYDILGHGYNITSAYLDPKASGALVLDIDKLKNRNLILEYKLEESQSRYTSGKDVYDFTSNMSSSLKIEPEFLKVIAGASLNVAFGGNNTYTSDYSFAYFTQKYVDSRFRIAESNINVLRECLTQQFKDRISSYTPAQIVEVYGTHVLKDIYVGAKLEVYYSSKSTTTSKKQNVDAGLGMSLVNIFKIDGKFNYDSSLATNNKEQSLFYSTVGGDPMVGLIGSLNPETYPSVDISKWNATVRNATPKFIDVDANSKSFIPIYELVADPAKSQEIKNYITSYTKNKELKSVTLYPTGAGMRSVSGLGQLNDGGGVTIADIDGNGKPDMILMGIDAPAKDNSFWYKVLFDIDENGYSSRQSKLYTLPGVGWDNAGGGVAIADLNKNGKPDMILLCADDPNNGNTANVCYRIAYDLKSDGSYSSISSPKCIPGYGSHYQGADIDINDINGNGIPDLLVAVYDNPKDMNSFVYQIAFDLDPSGNYKSLSPSYVIPGVGYEGDGAGVAVGDIDRNGKLDIIFMAIDAPAGSDTFVYRILPDIDKYGVSYSPLSDQIGLPTSLSPCQKGAGGGCCLYDIDNNGFLDVVFMAIKNDSKGIDNTWRYITGHNLNKQGIPMQWR
ncbi:VCBS repeat-containing protein [Oscillospiraceae bacterium N12]|uniref:VCBS repeat-containing protein n=1 Tax=Jilunia laotingensis TaxID=2763675 RepID=A0A926INT3_9BACT|nr:FG-GAP-like repeat-containing protein [Jilunia laotingensis]MBC8592574.1 VCBS repeat-containing protein [Jilunia laotingensis]